MKILFDQSAPAPLRRLLASHAVETAYEGGWSTLQNGELLTAAEAGEFNVFITADSNLKYQQNLKTRNIAIVVLSTTSWPRIEAERERIVSAVDSATPKSYTEVEIPYLDKSV